jgi:hypothetical protein
MDSRALYGESEERIMRPLITETTVRVPAFEDMPEEDIVIWNEQGLDEFLRKPSRSECAYDEGTGEWIGPLEPVDIVEGLAYESGMLGYATAEEDSLWRQQEDLDRDFHAHDDTKEYINDPEIEEALDQWRMGEGMDDLHEPSYFKEWVGEVAWVTDSKGTPRAFTPEMLMQRTNLNILCDEKCPFTGEIADQLLELEVVAVGKNHGVAKSQYGGVFLPAGVLKYLSHQEAGCAAGDASDDYGRIELGYKFKCWAAFTNAKYPWRTCVNGVVLD